jgi:hypothetical protein
MTKKSHTTPKPTTEKVLVLSTAHIKLETDSILSQLAFVPGDVPGCSDLPFGLSAIEYGYFLTICLDGDCEPDQEEFKARDIEDMYEMVKLAFDTKCPYIHIDSDGPVYQDLKTYDWGEITTD